jgi:ribosome-associated translation inhibitor RaiA
MKVAVNYKNLQSDPKIGEACQRVADKISRMLSKFPADSIHLKINLESNPHRKQFFSTFSLHLPDKILTATDSSYDDIRTPITECREEIIRQVKRFKADLYQGPNLRKAEKQHRRQPGE